VQIGNKTVRGTSIGSTVMESQYELQSVFSDYYYAYLGAGLRRETKWKVTG
jgi:hypothetical protein